MSQNVIDMTIPFRFSMNVLNVLKTLNLKVRQTIEGSNYNNRESSLIVVKAWKTIPVCDLCFVYGKKCGSNIFI